MEKSRKDFWWLILIGVLVVTISILHYMTPTTEGHFHLIYMQAYFMPILIAAFQFGVRGGVITALMISLIYVPHIMLQWVGDTEHTLLGALQIIMFNIIGYLTGLKAQKENHEKVKYQVAANDLEKSLEKLRQQSNELADLEEQLRFSDRLAIVGELTSSLAHELRNPLGTIRGTVEILNEELPEDTKKTEFFQILVQETERMSAVVENYLNFARKQSEPASQYDVREIVNNTCLILASRARKEQINIQKYLPDNPIFLKGDPNDLRQILVNLLLNAIEAMSSPGQITLAAKLSVAKAKLVNSLEIENNPMVLQLSLIHI